MASTCTNVVKETPLPKLIHGVPILDFTLKMLLVTSHAATQYNLGAKISPTFVSIFVATITLSASFALSSISFSPTFPATAAFFEKVSFFLLAVASASMASAILHGTWYAWLTYATWMIPAMPLMHDAWQGLCPIMARWRKEEQGTIMSLPETTMAPIEKSNMASTTNVVEETPLLKLIHGVPTLAFTLTMVLVTSHAATQYNWGAKISPTFVSIFVATMTLSASFALSSISFSPTFPATAAFFEKVSFFFLTAAIASMASLILHGTWYGWLTYATCMIPAMPLILDTWQWLRPIMARWRNELEQVMFQQYDVSGSV